MAAEVSTQPESAESVQREAAWDRVKQRYRTGQLVEGVVEELQSYGVFFDIGARFPAFMDILDLPAEPIEVGRTEPLRIVQFADWNKQIRVAPAGSREFALERLKQLDRGAAARLEGEYLKLKAVYDRLSPDDLTRLRLAAALLVEADELLRHGEHGELGNFRTRLDYLEEYCDEQGEITYSNYGTFMPNIALQALDAWNQGHEFSPTSLFRLLTAKPAHIPSESSE
ncbi:MAG: hypothetical protein AB7I48_03090 [Planctomycetaceae bacterium]